MPAPETVPKRHAVHRVAVGTLRIGCVGALLLASCAAPPEATARAPHPAALTPPVAQPEVLTPQGILRSMADTYANCHTYRDSGRATLKLEAGAPGPVIFTPFQTAFERPDRFRFGAEMSAPLIKLGWIVWRRGPAVRSWSRHDGFEKPESLSSALGALAGVSWSTSITVPKLLVADGIPDSGLTQMTDVVRLEDEEVNGSRCYCLRGRELTGTTTVCIDQTSHLLLRVVRQLVGDGLHGEVTITYEPVIDEVIPADLLAFGSPEG
jgi:hypothetical protein